MLLAAVVMTLCSSLQAPRTERDSCFKTFGVVHKPWPLLSMNCPPEGQDLDGLRPVLYHVKMVCSMRYGCTIASLGASQNVTMC